MSHKLNELWEANFESEKEALRALPVPSARLEEAIRAGVRRASEERRRPGRIRRAALRAGSIAAAILVLFVVTMRVSPAFAETIGKLPGLDIIAGWFQTDKGLQTAVRNDYFQPLGLEAEQDGWTLRLEGAIPDERRLVLFYTIRRDGVPTKDYRLTNFNFRLPDGASFEGGYGVSQQWFGNDHEEMMQMADINFSEGVRLPNEFIFEASPAAYGGSVGPVWQIPVSLKEWGGPDHVAVYELNRTVAIEDQQVQFLKAAVYPTRIVVTVRYDENNEKRIFSMMDLKLTGDRGEVFTTKGAQRIDERTEEIYFEGSSFALPDSLVLSGSAARALDKTNLEIVLDTEQGTLLKAPDERLALEHIFETGNGWVNLKFRLAGIAEDDNMMYSLVESQFTDASGRVFETGYGHIYGTSEENRAQTVIFQIPAEDYEQPLRFKVFNYPSYIREPFEIKIR